MPPTKSKKKSTKVLPKSSAKASATSSKRSKAASKPASKKPVPAAKSRKPAAITKSPPKAVGRGAGMKRPPVKTIAKKTPTPAANAAKGKTPVGKKPMATAAKSMTVKARIPTRLPAAEAKPITNKTAVVEPARQNGDRPVPIKRPAPAPRPSQSAAPASASREALIAADVAPLVASELEQFRIALLEKRAELMGDVGAMESEAFKGGQNLSNMPIHMADVGTDNFEQEFTLGLVESDRNLLREIHESLGRIQDGSYGTCVATGKPIGRARLEAKPWAKYCIEYTRMLEQGLAQGGRDSGEEGETGREEEEE